MKNNLFNRLAKKVVLFGTGVSVLANIGCSTLSYNFENKDIELEEYKYKLTEKTKKDTIMYKFNTWKDLELTDARVNGQEVSDSSLKDYQKRMIENLRDIDSVECKKFCDEYEKQGHNRDSLKRYFYSEKSIFR